MYIIPRALPIVLYIKQSSQCGKLHGMGATYIYRTKFSMGFEGITIHLRVAGRRREHFQLYAGTFLLEDIIVVVLEFLKCCWKKTRGRLLLNT